jgi:hypothetical protein
MPIVTERLAETIAATKRLLRAQLPAYAEAFAEVSEHIRSEAVFLVVSFEPPAEQAQSAFRAHRLMP